MALYNKYETIVNSAVDNNINRVYLNPNFNKPSGNNYRSTSVMHVNPRFSHLLSSSIQPNSHKARIYVNPNFMKSTKSAADGFEYISNVNTNNIHQNTVSNQPNSLHTYEQQKTEKQKSDVPVPIAKSRYCLVRQNATKVLEGPVVEKTKNTYQVNKYKSIPLNVIKRNLETVINNKTTTILTSINPNNVISSDNTYAGSVPSSTGRNRFKLVNHNNVTPVKNDKIKTKTLIDKVHSSQKRLKKKGNLKKNNIPCPMFRKFGKCLRKLHGKCEFLHDKKHVSICRKFIKGLCHNKGCLLSHDLTTKKMPTCYFYLQGTCTKLDCPYLHVKLNEKVKICPDFVKGYCEKGSKCLQRHINAHSENKGKDSVVTKLALTSKRKYSKEKDKKNNHNKSKCAQSSGNSAVTEKTEHNTDCRYYQEYKDDINASDKCETIKPMRCKLGALPSFIQL